MLEAARLAAKSSSIDEANQGNTIQGRYYLVWDSDQTLEVPTFFHKASGLGPSETTLDLIIKTLNPRLNRDRDLFLETPAEFHLITISPERHIAGWLMHHVAGDAATGTDVGQETLANYHEIIRGRKPDWAGEYYSISGSKKSTSEPQETNYTKLSGGCAPDFSESIQKALSTS